MSQEFIVESGDQQNLHNENVENDETNASDSEKAGVLLHSEDTQQPLIYLDDDILKLNKHIEERIRNLQKVSIKYSSKILISKNDGTLNKYWLP